MKSKMTKVILGIVAAVMTTNVQPVLGVTTISSLEELQKLNRLYSEKTSEGSDEKTSEEICIYLRGPNSLTEGDCDVICKVLRNSKIFVTELNLFLNEIGDKGAKAIAEALKVNTTLTQLTLEDDLLDKVIEGKNEDEDKDESRNKNEGEDKDGKAVWPPLPIKTKLTY